MPGKLSRNRHRKGFATIYVTMVAMFLLVPMAGLAIDFGMLYNIKARLQTACDAAAIGAGYLLHATTNISNPTQLAAITTAAQQFFYANYPSNYMGSTVTTYTANVASGTTGKSITVNATVKVPMLLMRVLGIKNSQVSAKAVSNVKFIAMMIVVDRSGSVVNEGAASTIQSALSTFVGNSATSYLVDGVDTVGMVSFGGTWRLDFAPITHFQTAASNIAGAINNIPFDANSSTNTAEGLYQGWEQLYQLDQTGALNVIVLLTDGRPSAFTGYFTPTSSSSCSSKSQRKGVFETYVSLGSSWPFWPPPSSPNDSYGIFTPQYQGTPENSASYVASPSSGCAYASNVGNVGNDFNNSFPTSVGPVDNVGSGYVPSYTTPGTGLSTQTGYYSQSCTNSTDPQCGRYAAFNAADNLATLIRSDTTLSPMLFVIGLNYTDGVTEPLDEDWLARVANDPNYVSVGSDPGILAAGNSVYQSGQTPGMYCNSTTATLSNCFAQVTSHLLRLIQ